MYVYLTNFKKHTKNKESLTHFLIFLENSDSFNFSFHMLLNDSVNYHGALHGLVDTASLELEHGK